MTAITISRSTASRPRWPLARAIALAILALAACSRLGVGARVHDLGDGQYRIDTSQAADVNADNAAAAKETCPAGYTIVQKGVQAESLYGSMILGADLATFWIVKCNPGK
jgi:hypothetical protein